MGAPLTISIRDHSLHVAILREPMLYINCESNIWENHQGLGGLLASEYEKAVKEELFWNRNKLYINTLLHAINVMYGV
jgi:hypothetical protein